MHPAFCNRSVSVSDFQMGRLLGRGGFGNVYEARYCPSGTEEPIHVAVKVMEKQKIIDSNMSMRVRNEVLIHSQLHHPSILRLYHFFEDATNVYLVMEVCHNGELFKYIQNRRKLAEQSGSQVPQLTEPEVRHIMLQIVRGVQHLHSSNIIHRDLKLANMLFTKDFDVKIADFGLAIKLNNPDGEQLTMCGTPNYISPEIITRLPYGLASDVWSVGCMFFTILTGRPPFDTGAVKETLKLVAKATFQLPSDVSHDAAGLIRGMLQKNPDQRITMDGVLGHDFFKLPSCAPKDLSKFQLKTPQSHQHHIPPPPATKMNFVESSKNCLPKFSTERLRPLKQETKFGLVEILTSGHLVLDFVEDKYRILISPDGDSILFFVKPITAQWSIKSAPTHTCSRVTIPEKYAKRYRYACKFVDVVRSKTPRITYQSPQAKCIFMDNSPISDFDVIFHAGSRIVWLLTKGELILKETSPAKETKIMSQYPVARINNRMDILSVGDKLEALLPQTTSNVNWIQLWKHTVECYCQCWEIDSNTSPTAFPLTLKSGAGAVETNHSPAASSAMNDENTPFNRYNPPTTCSLHLTDVIAPSMSVAPSGFTGFPMRNDYSRMSTMNSYQVSTKVYDQSLATSPMNAPILGGTKSAPLAFSKPDHSLSSLSYAHLHNVGWCVRRNLQQGSSEFSIMFNDGYRIIIESCINGSKSSNLIFFHAQPHANVERYVIDRNLPAHVKQRLAYFSRFIELLQRL